MRPRTVLYRSKNGTRAEYPLQNLGKVHLAHTLWQLCLEAFGHSTGRLFKIPMLSREKADRTKRAPRGAGPLNVVKKR